MNRSRKQLRCQQSFPKVLGKSVKKKTQPGTPGTLVSFFLLPMLDFLATRYTFDPQPLLGFFIFKAPQLFCTKGHLHSLRRHRGGEHALHPSETRMAGLPHLAGALCWKMRRAG